MNSDISEIFDHQGQLVTEARMRATTNLSVMKKGSKELIEVNKDDISKMEQTSQLPS